MYTRLRYLAEINPPVPVSVKKARDEYRSFVPMQAIGEDWSLDLAQQRRISEMDSGYSYFEDGDIAVAKVTPCFENGKAVIMHGLTEGSGFGTTEVTVIRPKTDINTKYLFYVLVENGFRQLGKAEMTGAGGLKRVPDRIFRNYPVRVLPRSTQDSVVAYLDRETAAIGAFIADQEELIGLLRERRNATITHAVSRGIDAAVGMKETGIESLGQVPEHWAVSRVASTVLSAKNGVWGVEPDGIHDLRCVRVADFDRAGQRIHDHDVTFRHIPQAERSGRILTRGNLLLEKSGGGDKSPVGFVVLYDRDEPAVASNFIARVELRDGMEPRYWTYVHGSLYARRVNSRSIKQSTGIQNLDQSSYFNEIVGIPPAGEQVEIADYLDRETILLDDAAADAREAIELSRERRGALISAVLAGKIDVPEESS